MVRYGVKHVRDRTTWSHCVDCNLLAPAILRHHSHKGVDSPLRPRVQGVLRHAKLFGSIRRHEDNAAALVQVSICLAGNKKLAAGIQTEDAVKFFLFLSAFRFS
jgi:hypothetical protein